MIAALATLAFAATLWLIVMVSAQMLLDSAEKIKAALNPDAGMHPRLNVAQLRVSPRVRARAANPVRVAPQWRAAA